MLTKPQLTMIKKLIPEMTQWLQGTPFDTCVIRLNARADPQKSSVWGFTALHIAVEDPPAPSSTLNMGHHWNQQQQPEQPQGKPTIKNALAKPRKPKTDCHDRCVNEEHI